MVLVLGLGLWLALGPGSKPHFDVRPGATQVEVRIADTRGVLESLVDPTTGRSTYRVFMKGEAPSREFSEAEAREFLTQSTLDRARALGANPVFKALNITSWVGVVWVGIGLFGQLAFSGRMVLQWFVSERRKESVITESFWWFSLCGAMMLFTYFVWRQDPIGILGQASGIVIYARNIRLIHKKKRRVRRDEQRRAAIEASLTDAAQAESAADVRRASGMLDGDAAGASGNRTKSVLQPASEVGGERR
jgi:lipid-A-disaccharide synthase-like uncharacterized protein